MTGMFVELECFGAKAKFVMRTADTKQTFLIEETSSVSIVSKTARWSWYVAFNILLKFGSSMTPSRRTTLVLWEW